MQHNVSGMSGDPRLRGMHEIPLNMNDMKDVFDDFLKK
jgi:hypothetical protein